MPGTRHVLIISCALLLGGCSTLNSAARGVGSFFQDAFRTSDDFGKIDPAFRSSATAACSARATQYGEVAITRVWKSSMNTLVVDGITQQTGYPQRAFTCSFSSEGQIADFKRG